jgi:RimJ/RimL family protein N-acetyltransferase
VLEEAVDFQPSEKRSSSRIGTATLHDGSQVDLYPMCPRDAARLLRFHHALSPETTYLRFFSFHPELSRAELHRFTHVDHVDREAIVAVASGEIVAVARFDRESDRVDAEIAFVVADSWQGRGLGTVLLHHLATRARALGVRRFVAETLPHNAPMLAVFHHSGLPYEQRFAGGVVHVTLDLASVGAQDRT